MDTHLQIYLLHWMSNFDYSWIFQFLWFRNFNFKIEVILTMRYQEGYIIMSKSWISGFVVPIKLQSTSSSLWVNSYQYQVQPDLLHNNQEALDLENVVFNWVFSDIVGTTCPWLDWRNVSLINCLIFCHVLTGYLNCCLRLHFNCSHQAET